MQQLSSFWEAMQLIGFLCTGASIVCAGYVLMNLLTTKIVLKRSTKKIMDYARNSSVSLEKPIGNNHQYVRENANAIEEPFLILFDEINYN